MCDPHADKEEVKREYGVDLLPEINCSGNGQLHDAVILAVWHTEFISIDIKAIKKGNAVVFDTKAVLDRPLVDARL